MSRRRFKTPAPACPKHVSVDARSIRYTAAYSRALRIADLFSKMTRIDRRLLPPRIVYGLVWDRCATKLENDQIPDLPPFPCPHCRRRYEAAEHAVECCNSASLAYVKRAARPAHCE